MPGLGVTASGFTWSDDGGKTGRVVTGDELRTHQLAPLPPEITALVEITRPGPDDERVGESACMDRAQAAFAAGFLAYAAGVQFATLSEHDGLPVAWICEECGQPLAEGGRCGSGLHVGPDGSGFRGMAIASTDVVAERNRMRQEIAQLRGALRAAGITCPMCGGLPPGQASGAGDLCTCPPDTNGGT